MKSYKENYEKFCRKNPHTASLLEHLDCSHLKFCKTDSNELNLINSSSSDSLGITLHDQRGALCEAKNWTSIQPLETIDTLIVYGLGLGYYYLPLKEWLKKRRKRLVFLEKDPCVIKYFLQTELAKEMLTHSKIDIWLIPEFYEANHKDKLRPEAEEFFLSYTATKKHISALASYLFHDSSEFKQRHMQMQYLFWLTSLMLYERSAHRMSPFIKNFYGNIYSLAGSVPATALFGRLPIPAILCGAGPSITQQLPKLKKLKNKAMIVAAGSCANVLSSAKIVPHLIGGIDQHKSQIGRLRTNYAFNAPIVYTNSFYTKALEEYHGPRIYMSENRTIPWNKWFEKELGLESSTEFDMGVSTSTYLLSVLTLLQTNPIIMIGMDLAYTQNKHYAKGVVAHPKDHKSISDYIKDKLPKTYTMTNADGSTSETTLEWYKEAMVFFKIKRQHPNFTLLNATQKGMQIPEIQNIKLQLAIDKYLNDFGDIQGWIHGTMQNAIHHEIDIKSVEKALNIWNLNLEACKKHLITSIAKGNKALIDREIAYQFMLKFVENDFSLKNMSQQLLIRRMPDGPKKKQLQKRYESKKYKEFLKYLDIHLKVIKEAVKHHDQKQKHLSHIKQSFSHIDLKKQKENQILNEEERLYLYPNGKTKVKCNFKEGQLHGPWSFYSDNGVLLANSHYLLGKIEGTSHYYYHTGELYSIQEYSLGLSDGKFLYYYPDGILKAEENYLKGELHGIVHLFHPNGRLKRELYFNHGTLIPGTERFWNESGRLYSS